MPEEIFVLIAMGMAFSLAWSVLAFIKSVALKRMELKAGANPDATHAELDELHRRMETLEEGVVSRMQELEERMDFTERVLAREGRGQLPPSA